ncbi:MAG: class I SAM-dependent methyltransferase [Bacteroidota bacterium]
MKLHRVTVQAVVNALEEIFVSNRYADKVIERILKSNPKWGARDRAFIAENVYGIVRNWRFMNFITDNSEYKANKGSLWYITGAWLFTKEYEIPEWPEFKNINFHRIIKLINEAQHLPAIQQSYPDWLHQLMLSTVGESWYDEMIALNQQAPLVLRVNTLKTTPAELISQFESQGITAKPISESYPDALIINKRVNLFSNPLFEKGWFEVQDASSQRVAHFMEIKPGQTIIDACAGAGGKSLHIASVLKNKGKIIAMDKEEWKLKELKRRANRAGVYNIETQMASPESTQSLFESADCLLLDVPCSGLGVLKRNPDAKWKLSMDFIEKVQSEQSNILVEYSKMLKQGGFLTYVTCSILPDENQKQIQKFLAQNNNYTLLKEQSFSPNLSGFDGFYMALLQKN